MPLLGTTDWLSISFTLTQCSLSLASTASDRPSIITQTSSEEKALDRTPIFPALACQPPSEIPSFGVPTNEQGEAEFCSRVVVLLSLQPSWTPANKVRNSPFFLFFFLCSSSSDPFEASWQHWFAYSKPICHSCNSKGKNLFPTFIFSVLRIFCCLIAFQRMIC